MGDWSKFLSSLALPARVSGGIFAALLLILVFNSQGWVRLVEIVAWAPVAVIVGATLFGCLFGASLIDNAIKFTIRLRKRSALVERQEKRQKEKDAAQNELYAEALARLDHLSDRQIQFVADALRAGSPSFLTYMDDPDISILMSFQLVTSPGGSHNQAHYPFFFNDIAWAEILKRKEEFLQKADELDNKKR